MITAVYNRITCHNSFIEVVLDFLSLVVTTVLTIVIYRLERRHEKNREYAEKKAAENAVIEAAKIFLIDNDDEIEYLPLAVIAEKLQLKRKHYRTLITRYLRCDKQVQQEILRQSNIPETNISMDAVNAALPLLQADLDKNDFGRNIFYDGAKYLHRAFERWAEIPIKAVNPYIFEDLRKSEWHDKGSAVPWRISYNTTSLSAYMWDYLRLEEIGIDKKDIPAPIDMVFQHCELGTCEESDMTFWTMRIVLDACYTFKPATLKSTIFDEHLIQTQEDMYYYTLAILCLAYGQKNGEENGKI